MGHTRVDLPVLTVFLSLGLGVVFLGSRGPGLDGGGIFAGGRGCPLRSS